MNVNVNYSLFSFPSVKKIVMLSSYCVLAAVLHIPDIKTTLVEVKSISSQCYKRQLDIDSILNRVVLLSGMRIMY